MAYEELVKLYEGIGVKRQISIKDIIIGNRFRKEVGDISGLANSIKNNGLIHPISITRNGNLVAGRRRIEAFKNLGLEQIPAFKIDINILENGEIDENSVRKNFTPEEMIAVKKYLDSREINLESESQIKPGSNKPPSRNNQGHPNFGLPKRSKRIAKAIGISDTNLRKLEILHEAASNDSELFGDLWHKVNASKISTNKAFNTYKRISQRNQLIKESQQCPSTIPSNVQLIQNDFVQASKKIPDNSIDLIFTDPPYDEKSLSLYKELAVIAIRVLKSGGSLVCYCGTYGIPQILEFMKEVGLTYYWIIAVKLQGSFARAWRKDVSIKWKPLLWHIKGETKFDTTEFISDHVESTNSDKISHDWQESTSEARHVISRLTLENHTVLDLMMGSGTTGIAALQLNRKFIGIEIDPNTFEIARSRINQVVKSEVHNVNSNDLFTD
jgi:16S rRNA G966 N2-methylase RsmD